MSATARQVVASTAQLRWDDVDDVVRKVTTIIEDAGCRWRFLRIDRVVADLSSDATTPRHALHESMRLTLRSLIRAIVIRLAIAKIAASADHIRQVEFRPGYEHNTSFHRDFSRCLGMSPSEFRVLPTPRAKH